MSYVFFLFSHYRVGHNRLHAVKKNYSEGNGLPRERRRGPRTNPNFLSKSDAERVVTFIQNYAAEHATVLPGRHPGRKDFTAKLLPTHISKAEVHRQYETATNTANDDAREKDPMAEQHRVVGIDTFKRLWKTLLPSIATAKPRTDLCGECHDNNYQVYRSHNLPEAAKTAKLQKQLHHLDIVNRVRIATLHWKHTANFSVTVTVILNGSLWNG